MCSAMTNWSGKLALWTLTAICIYVFSYDKLVRTTAMWTLTATCTYVFSYDKSTRTNSPVNVNISFAIEDVIKLEEINHIFHLKDSRDFNILYIYMEIKYRSKYQKSQNMLITSRSYKICSVTWKKFNAQWK